MKSKKADVTFIFISVVITILVFFTLLPILTSTNKQLITEFEELGCKAYVNAKSSSVAKAADFFYKVKLNCNN